MSVDAGYALWLKAGARYTTAIETATNTMWGSKATTTEMMSPLALKAGADAEVARQVIFLSGPLAVDTHVIKGARRDLVGQCITLTGDRLGYEASANVFVIEADEHDGADLTTITVLKRLP